MHRQLIKHLLTVGIKLREHKFKEAFSKPGITEPETPIASKEYVERIKAIRIAVEEGRLQRRDALENAILYVALKQITRKTDAEISAIIKIKPNTIMRIKSYLGLEKRNLPKTSKELQSRDSLLKLVSEQIQELLKNGIIPENKQITAQQAEQIKKEIRKALAEKFDRKEKSIGEVLRRHEVTDQNFDELLQGEGIIEQGKKIRIQERRKILSILAKHSIILKNSQKKLNSLNLRESVLNELGWSINTFYTKLSKTGIGTRELKEILSEPEKVI
ncbi:MAG: hypothetical protein Q7K42_04090, partial [Candidatus Diapherotrites archaeon]|nr:hypothetical protein [Candidatus Diapherotrites archaeon]